MNEYEAKIDAYIMLPHSSTHYIRGLKSNDKDNVSFGVWNWMLSARPRVSSKSKTGNCDLYGLNLHCARLPLPPSSVGQLYSTCFNPHERAAPGRQERLHTPRLTRAPPAPPWLPRASAASACQPVRWERSSRAPQRAQLPVGLAVLSSCRPSWADR